MGRIKRYTPPRRLIAKITRISAYSFVLVISTFLGLYAGIQLDQFTGMAPNFTLLGLIMGIVLGFRGFIQEAVTERKGQS